jgi:hypothetical protein
MEFFRSCCATSPRKIGKSEYGRPKKTELGALNHPTFVNDEKAGTDLPCRIIRRESVAMWRNPSLFPKVPIAEHEAGQSFLRPALKLLLSQRTYCWLISERASPEAVRPQTRHHKLLVRWQVG